MPDPFIDDRASETVAEAGPGMQPRGFDRRDIPGESAFDHTADELTEFGVTARSQTRLVLRRFFRHRAAMVSLVILILMVAAAFLAPHYYKFSYLEQTNSFSSPPSTTHWFGTDTIGIDTYASVMQGATKSIEIGLLVAIFSTLIGVFVGALTGFYRGLVDAGLMRMTDLFLIMPDIAVLAVVANRFRNQSGNWFMIALVITLFAWMYQARLTRAEFLSLRERDYVLAARALGASDRRIIGRHLLPNALGSIIVNATLTVSAAIITEATLSFLGFGITPPDISLGKMVSDGADTASTRWWLFYLPGLFLIVMLLCINFIGDGLRDAFDPTQDRLRA